MKKTDSTKHCKEHELATIKIQKTYRRYSARKKFTFFKLCDSKLTHFRADIIGNDPIFTGLSDFRLTHGKSVIVGISGARSIWIAADIAYKQKATPKIFLIDNSADVHHLWIELKKIAHTSINGKEFIFELVNTIQTTPSVFFDELLKHPIEPCDIAEKHYHTPDGSLFFSQLFARYGFERIKAIIMHATVIKQSWADKETFEKINNHIKQLEAGLVVTYASNLVSYYEYKNAPISAQKILRNIDALKPGLSIHTNYDAMYSAPSSYFLLDYSEPELVARVLATEGMTEESRESINQTPSSLYLLASPSPSSATTASHPATPISAFNYFVAPCSIFKSTQLPPLQTTLAQTNESEKDRFFKP